MPHQQAPAISEISEEPDLLAEPAATNAQTEQTDQQKLPRAVKEYPFRFFDHLKMIKPAIALTFQFHQNPAYSNAQWIGANAGLRPAEGIHAQVRKQPQKEFVEIELLPDFAMRLQFQGNYDRGDIDLLSNNFDGFGLAYFGLDPTDVTHHLLDEIGRFLPGRNVRLPETLTSTRFMPARPIYG